MHTSNFKSLIAREENRPGSLYGTGVRHYATLVTAAVVTQSVLVLLVLRYGAPRILAESYDALKQPRSVIGRSCPLNDL